MARRVLYLAVTIGVGVTLAGCALSFLGYERRAEWRDKEERICAVRRVVRASPYIQPARHMNDRGACGIDKPLLVAAVGDGTVAIGPTATLNCPMTGAVEHWLGEAVQPAAVAWFGTPVASIRQISSYACRSRNNEAGERLSEHAFGNALDVASFTLRDGRTITVKNDWNNGDPNARGFLREVFAAACERFKTVLGPGVKYHGDHFHLDLAHHNAAGTSRYCKPMPDGAPPHRRPLNEGGLFASLDWNRTASISADGGESADGIGELLTEMPPDVIATEMVDPFGTYDGNPDEPN